MPYQPIKISQRPVSSSGVMHLVCKSVEPTVGIGLESNQRRSRTELLTCASTIRVHASRLAGYNII